MGRAYTNSEEIEEEIELTGELVSEEPKMLYLVSKPCPIQKMLIDEIEVQPRLA